MRLFPLKPTKQRLFRGKVHGFDIETCNKNKTFLCGTFSFHDGTFKTCFSKKEVIELIKHDPRFPGSIVSCTNCGFDFFGTFFNTDDMKNFVILFRQSHLIFAKTWIRDHQLFPTRGDYKKKNCSCTFIDTLNYNPVGVKDLGKIVGIKKLDYKPLGKRPKDKKKWAQLIKYNQNDALISRVYMSDSIIKDFEDLGGTFKLTIASTCMSLFRNKYLKDTYFSHPVGILKELFKGYYGGRTEALCRGITGECNYYDFNSTYAKQMTKKFPDPSSLRFDRNNIDCIRNFEGISHVKVFCPKMKYPVLPLRSGDKTLFPCGTFEGYYCHNELRYAMEQGYVVMEIFKSYYFLRTIPIFKDYVETLYVLRKEFKAKGDPREVTMKLAMNSLYGKFAQGFVDQDNYVHESQVTEDMLESCTRFERVGQFFRFFKSETRPALYCFPEWSAYVTSYARISLHQAMVQCNPYYVDTDSLLTKHEMPVSKELGDLKLEMKIQAAAIIKPKFYAFIGTKDGQLVEETKIKGFSRVKSIIWQDHHIKFRNRKFFNFLEFLGFIQHPKAKYNKIAKFKEAIKRGFVPNEEIEVEKDFVLEDDKRVWEEHDIGTVIHEDRLIESEAINIDEAR